MKAKMPEGMGWLDAWGQRNSGKGFRLSWSIFFRFSKYGYVSRSNFNLGPPVGLRLAGAQLAHRSSFNKPECEL